MGNISREKTDINAVNAECGKIFLYVVRYFIVRNIKLEVEYFGRIHIVHFVGFGAFSPICQKM